MTDIDPTGAPVKNVIKGVIAGGLLVIFASIVSDYTERARNFYKLRKLIDVEVELLRQQYASLIPHIDKTITCLDENRIPEKSFIATHPNTFMESYVDAFGLLDTKTSKALVKYLYDGKIVSTLLVTFSKDKEKHLTSKNGCFYGPKLRRNEATESINTYESKHSSSNQSETAFRERWSKNLSDARNELEQIIQSGDFIKENLGKQKPFIFF